MGAGGRDGGRRRGRLGGGSAGGAVEKAPVPDLRRPGLGRGSGTGAVGAGGTWRPPARDAGWRERGRRGTWRPPADCNNAIKNYSVPLPYRKSRFLTLSNGVSRRFMNFFETRLSKPEYEGISDFLHSYLYIFDLYRSLKWCRARKLQCASAIVISRNGRSAKLTVFMRTITKTPGHLQRFLTAIFIISLQIERSH